MNEKLLDDFEKELDNLTLKDLWENENIIGRLLKMNILISDFLRMINPKKKPIYIKDEN